VRAKHRCPKCDHGEVLHVPEPRDTNLDRMAIGADQGWYSITPIGQLEAYVCMKCGYTELYVRDVGAIDLKKLPDARVLRAEARSEYR
jgi:predicted nucleic-acid-binding Zn-ribbon protein